MFNERLSLFDDLYLEASSRVEMVKKPLLRRKWAKVAEKLFIEASGQYPASVTAQASHIAIHCRREGLDPTNLARALYIDRGKVHNIQKLAIRAHKARGRELDEPYKIRNVKAIIVSDFAAADRLLESYDDNQLVDITKKYGEFINSEIRRVGHDHSGMRTYVEAQLSDYANKLTSGNK